MVRLVLVNRKLRSKLACGFVFHSIRFGCASDLRLPEDRKSVACFGELDYIFSTELGGCARTFPENERLSEARNPAIP